MKKELAIFGLGVITASIFFGFIYLFFPIQVGLSVAGDETLSDPDVIRLQLRNDNDSKIFLGGYELSREELAEKLERIFTLFGEDTPIVITYPTSMSRYEVYQIPSKFGIPRKNIAGYTNTIRYEADLMNKANNVVEPTASTLRVPAVAHH
jgi:hypothetical protein